MSDMLLERHHFIYSCGNCFDAPQKVASADAVFDDCQYEAAYCWVASEQSKTAIISGPPPTLNILGPSLERNRKKAPIRNSSFEEMEAGLPTTRRSIVWPLGTSLQLQPCDQICDQHAFRNECFPLEIALSAVILCSERWEPERQRLRGKGTGETPCRAREQSGADDIISRNGSLRNSVGAQRLREFDVISSRRALRALLRFLFPGSTPYLRAFALDVDMVGNTIILTVITDRVKAESIGYGIDFEEKFVKSASLDLKAISCNKKQIAANAEELASMHVVFSFLFCGSLKIAVTAETDGVAAQFNPLKNTVACESCCSNTACDSGHTCVFTRQRIGTNDCLLHSCKKLSLLEEQLLQGVAPLVELKSYSESRGLQWGETVDQMRLGGAKLLLKGSHNRGKLRTLELLPASICSRANLTQRSEREKWEALASVLLKLQEVARNARSRSGESSVGCVRVTFDGVSSYLKIEERDPESLRLSAEAASWLA